MKVIKNLAFVFPGQGSQSVGMLSELAAAHPSLRDTFEEASTVLGRDLWLLACDGPAEALARTELTQPLMLAGGVALWRLWTGLEEVRPARLAGHSLGEYTALVAAGSLDFADAVRAVAERGRLMQSAVPEGEGAMAAILGLDDETVEAICREVAESQAVAAANYNSPGQIVIAGDSAAVERAVLACLDAGAKRAVKLAMSVPSHCSLMAPAAEGLRAVLSAIEFRTPQIAVIHNADLQSHAEPDNIRAALVAQLCAPVRWADTVRLLKSQGTEILAECGPGRVLSALGRRIERSQQWFPLDSSAGLEALRQTDLEA
ncbi:MAG: ACP S-malonyltransferase [Wenzhouxiangella sp.]